MGNQTFYEGKLGNGKFYEGIIDEAMVSALDKNNGQPNPLVTVSPDRQYVNTFVTIDTTGTWIDSGCAEIAFLNIGDGNFPTPVGANVVILGFTIKPGFGISFDGDEHEVDMTKYQINFTGTGTQNCAVFRKMYR